VRFFCIGVVFFKLQDIPNFFQEHPTLPPSMSSDQLPSAYVLRHCLTALGLGVYGNREDMWRGLKSGAVSPPMSAHASARAIKLLRPRTPRTNGIARQLTLMLFGKIMRKCFYGILFCKYAKDGIRRAFTMHAMLKRLPIQELRAKIYEEAKVMHVKQSKEDMFMALWAAMPCIKLPILLTKSVADKSGLRFVHACTPDGFYFYKRKWFVESFVRS